MIKRFLPLVSITLFYCSCQESNATSYESPLTEAQVTEIAHSPEWQAMLGYSLEEAIEVGKSMDVEEWKRVQQALTGVKDMTEFETRELLLKLNLSPAAQKFMYEFQHRAELLRDRYDLSAVAKEDVQRISEAGIAHWRQSQR